MSGTLLDRLGRCRRVHIDTNVLIYWIEKQDPYRSLIRPMFETISAGRMSAVSSILTLAELLVLPLRARHYDLARQYKDLLLATQNFRLVDVDATIADQSARLRARYDGLKTPDSLQLATALSSRADIFLTNDDRLKRVEGIEIVVLKDLLGSPPS